MVFVSNPLLKTFNFTFKFKVIKDHQSTVITKQLQILPGWSDCQLKKALKIKLKVFTRREKEEAAAVIETNDKHHQ